MNVVEDGFEVSRSVFSGHRLPIIALAVLCIRLMAMNMQIALPRYFSTMQPIVLEKTNSRALLGTILYHLSTICVIWLLAYFAIYGEASSR